MFNLSGSEIIVILLLALVVLGPEKLPEALRRAGRTYAELKKMSSGFQSEVRSAFEEPVQEMRETADLLRKAATFDGSDDAKPGAKPTRLLTDADARSQPATELGDADDDDLLDDEDLDDDDLLDDDELLDDEDEGLDDSVEELHDYGAVDDEHRDQGDQLVDGDGRRRDETPGA